MNKKYRKHKDLIKAAISNIERPLTENEKIYKNILILSGIKNPSNDLIREAVRNVAIQEEK